MEIVILFDAPAARLKLVELTVGTAIPSIDLTATENVSAEEPTLVIVTLSEFPAPAAPEGTVMATKLTVAGTDVRPAPSEPNRSSLPPPAYCGNATLDPG